MSDLRNIDLTDGRKLSNQLDINITPYNSIMTRLRDKSSNDLVVNSYNYSNIIDRIHSWSITTTTSSIDNKYNNDSTSTYTFGVNNVDLSWDDYFYISTSTNTVTQLKGIANWHFESNLKESLLSRLRNYKWCDVTSFSPLLDRIITDSQKTDKMKNSIRRFKDQSISNEHDNAIYRFYDDTDDSTDQWNQTSFSANRRSKIKLMKSIPFLTRLYSTTTIRLFDEIEYNLDMAIAKERLDEAIQDTMYTAPVKQPENNILITNEVNETWIIPTIQSDLVAI